MISRLFGWIFTLISLAAVVFAALNWDNYTSLCFSNSDPIQNEIEEPVDELPIVDSLSLDAPMGIDEATEQQPAL